MNEITQYAIEAIEILQQHILDMGFRPVLHFEVEGTYTHGLGEDYTQSHPLDIPAINQQLRQHNIQGEFKAEYWERQWEWASAMQDQLPLKAAHDAAHIMRDIEGVLLQHGAHSVDIAPVSWGHDVPHRPLRIEDQRSMAVDKIIHVPNAIQVNMSLWNEVEQNLIAETSLGEMLQQQLLATAHHYCLLFCPEEDAFARLTLKDDYGLHEELSSPSDLSGGHQGSIALYRKRGKHNQLLGDVQQRKEEDGMISEYRDWQSGSRVEHRLGAASRYYNPYVNATYMLANMLDALQQYHGQKELSQQMHDALPSSLWGEAGAVVAFKSDAWFETIINQAAMLSSHIQVGTDLCAAIAALYKDKTRLSA